MTGNPSLTHDREAFVELTESVKGPVVVRAAASVAAETAPLSAYAALADPDGHSFLLESAEKTASSDPDGAFAADGGPDRHARYSFVGYDPEAVVRVYPDRTDVESLGGRAASLIDPGEGDTLDRLRGALPDVERVGFPETDRQTLEGGLVGFLAYDAVYDLWLEEVGVEHPESSLPDAEFVLTTRTLVFDEAADTVSLVFTPVVRPDDDPGEIYDELVAEAAEVSETLRDADSPETGGFTRSREAAGPRKEYEDAVERAKEHVLDGDIYQGVISRRRELYGEIDDLGFYEALRAVNPSPYMYVLRHGDRSIVGASPETLVSVDGDRVISNPLAGTCARGESPVEDRRLAGEMLADGKERAEHTMLVDLARNDVRRVSEPGSVEVEEFMTVLKYSHVQHLESTVTGTLAATSDAFDATRATFPAGTLTGAPKIRAMEIIDDLELSPREVYGGGVGYYAWNGDADFAIVIRTGTVEHGVESERGAAGQDGEDPSRPVDRDGEGPSRPVDRITVQAGAGIVADSDSAAEYEETEQKMGGVLAAIERIERESDGDRRSNDGDVDDPTADDLDDAEVDAR